MIYPTSPIGMSLFYKEEYYVRVNYCLHTLDFSCSVIPVFLLQAEGLVNSSGLPAVQLLAKALAKATVCVSFFSLVLVIHTEIIL